MPIHRPQGEVTGRSGPEATAHGAGPEAGPGRLGSSDLVDGPTEGDRANRGLLVLLVLIFRYVFQQFADISGAWDAIQTLTWRETAVLVLATVWSLFTYWIVVVLATPASPLRRRL